MRRAVEGDAVRAPVVVHPVQQVARQRRVVHRVVEVPLAAVPLAGADTDVFQPVRQMVANADEDLVARPALLLPYGHDQMDQARIARDDFGLGVDGQVIDGAALAGEPPLPGDPAGEEPVK
ncbi:hypothetical protein GCM10009530_29740 [Microbispora corallina]|uniref:Uncharacterized protein n=1 Tax=Microbispora corallina TaxID=83302 RepID=A0ABQ4FZW8_9ACTN|nr:hypothetical protein Mco01_33590 [Microbispora corallina]